MSFSKFAGVGSECGQSNGLSNLLTHFGQESGVQYDRLFEQRGEGSKLTFKSPVTYAQSSQNLANEFFKHQGEYNNSPHVYNTSFEPIKQQEQQQQLIKEDWTRDFMIHQSQPFEEEFESIYSNIHTTKSPIMTQQQTWADEFSIFQHQQVASSVVSEEEQLAFEKAFEEIADEGGINMVEDRDWDKEFADHELQEQEHNNNTSIPMAINNWPNSFNSSTVEDTHQHETQPLSKNTFDRQIIHEKEENKQWNRLEPYGKPYGYRTIHSNCQIYEYTPNNPYLLRQDAIDGITHTTLADTILALEAKVQLDPKDAKAWEELGLKQQENERDAVAITALEKAVSLDPTHSLAAWLGLAVSYTNEHCRMDAYNCLEQWIFNNSEYKHIMQERLGAHHDDAKKRHIYITNLFLEAARAAPGEEMDADVQVGLGILFNMSEEYGKAVDCFKAALITRPHDYQLWNKVGATLANSRDSTGAIEMYFNALEINPSFVRARYNLAISCMNLGQYKEAAEHLLTALALQRAAGEAAVSEHGVPANIPNGTSAGIWDSLRLLMYMMSREDLAAQCNHHNLDAFYGQFDF